MNDIKIIVCVVIGTILLVIAIISYWLMKKTQSKMIHQTKTFKEYCLSSIPLILGIAGVFVLLSLAF